MGDSRGRGRSATSTQATAGEVRVDSYAIPLSEIRSVRARRSASAYWGSSQAPPQAFNSVGFEAAGFCPDFALPIEKYHEITLSGRAAALEDRRWSPRRGNRLSPPGAGRSRGRRAANAAESRSTTPPRSTPAVDAYLSDLTNPGQGGLADELTMESTQAHEMMERYRKGNRAHRPCDRGARSASGSGIILRRPSRQVRPRARRAVLGAGSRGAAGPRFRRRGYLAARSRPWGGSGTWNTSARSRLQPLPRRRLRPRDGKVVLEGYLLRRSQAPLMSTSAADQRPIDRDSLFFRSRQPGRDRLGFFPVEDFADRLLPRSRPRAISAALPHHVQAGPDARRRHGHAGAISLSTSPTCRRSPPFTQSHAEHQNVLGGR